MPQLELVHFASQIFWLFVTFSVLYIIMAKHALPRVRETLQNRRSKITTDITQANDIMESAKQAEVDYNQSLQSARQKASNVIADAREKIQQQEIESYAKLEQNFAKQTKELEQRITFLRNDANDKLESAVVEFVQLSLSTLIQTSVNKKEVVSTLKRIRKE